VNSPPLWQQGNRKVVVVGPGAMGCLHAGLLGRAPHLEVALLDYRADRAELINEQGVIIEAPAGTYTVSVPCTADAQELSIADLVIIFTKAYDTATAAQNCALVVGPETAVLTLQNGLGNYQTLQENLPAEQVLAGTTSTGATVLVCWVAQPAIRRSPMRQPSFSVPLALKQRSPPM